MSTATCCVIVGSKDVTLAATTGAGIGGSIQTRAEPETGAELPAGGRELPAALVTHTRVAGPLPTVNVMVGVEPSASPATGAGLWVDSAAETGSTPAQRSARVTA